MGDHAWVTMPCCVPSVLLGNRPIARCIVSE